jgi:hypothetical protein
MTKLSSISFWAVQDLVLAAGGAVGLICRICWICGRLPWLISGGAAGGYAFWARLVVAGYVARPRPLISQVD